MPIISFACFCSYSLSLSLSSCCSLWLLLLHRGALSWLISWLQPLWRVNWRRRCLYLWIYGPASYPAAVAGGVFTACTRCISFYSWVCMYVFFCLEWNVRRIKFVFFPILLPLGCGESRFLCGRPTLHTRLLCFTQYCSGSNNKARKNKFNRLGDWWETETKE